MRPHSPQGHSAKHSIMTVALKASGSLSYEITTDYSVGTIPSLLLWLKKLKDEEFSEGNLEDLIY